MIIIIIHLIYIAPVRVPKYTRNKLEQTKQRMNVASVSQYGGKTGTEASSTIRKQTSLWRFRAHSGATIQHRCEPGRPQQQRRRQSSPAVNNPEVMVEGRRTEQRWTAHIVLSTSV